VDSHRFDVRRNTKGPGAKWRRPLLGLPGAVVLTLLVGHGAAGAPAKCAVFCAGLPGPRKAACVQACHQCNGDVTRVCNSPTGATCCAPDAVCTSDGTCLTVPPGCSGLGCSSSCGTFCSCVRTAENTVACVQQVCTFIPCVSTAECGAGSVCFTEGCCGGGGFCVPVCSGSPSGAFVE
jgi:hypothetical protein